MTPLTIADAFPLTMDAVYTNIGALLGATVVVGTILVMLGLKLAPRFVRSFFQSTIRA